MLIGSLAEKRWAYRNLPMNKTHSLRFINHDKTTETIIFSGNSPWKLRKMSKIKSFFLCQPKPLLSAHGANLLLFASLYHFCRSNDVITFFHLFVLHLPKILHGRHGTPAASWWRSKFVFASRPIEATSGEWKSAESSEPEWKAQCCTISRGSRHLVPMISISRIMFNAARQGVRSSQA